MILHYVLLHLCRLIIVICFIVVFLCMFICDMFKLKYEYKHLMFKHLPPILQCIYQNKFRITPSANIVIQIIPIIMFQLLCCKRRIRLLISVMIRGIKSISILIIKTRIWMPKIKQKRRIVITFIFNTFKNLPWSVSRHRNCIT